MNEEYSMLLSRTVPKVTRNEKENEVYTEILRDLDEWSRTLTRAEKELAELLIEDFEAWNYALPPAKPLDALRFLIDQHGLRQKDLVGVFEAPSVVSEVLSGRRQLSKQHIKRLSARFHVSPELFF